MSEETNPATENLIIAKYLVGIARRAKVQIRSNPEISSQLRRRLQGPISLDDRHMRSSGHAATWYVIVFLESGRVCEDSLCWYNHDVGWIIDLGDSYKYHKITSSDFADEQGLIDLFKECLTNID